MRRWIAAVGARTAFIELGSTWENGYIGSFNARLRDELLNGEIFYTLKEAQVLIESWRCHYNAVRPHASALWVTARVIGPAGIPSVSNSASSPMLGATDDGDFLFRTATSDVWQGPILAGVARERGFARLGLLYRADAWGRGLYDAAVALALAAQAAGSVDGAAIRDRLPEIGTGPGVSVIAGPADVAEHLPRLIDSYNDRLLHSALGYLSPNRYEEEQSCTPVKSAA